MATQDGYVFRTWDDGNTTITGTSPIFVDSKTKPVPVSRIKPKDLFANATARKVSSSVVVYTYGYNIPDCTKPAKIYAPQSYWGPLGDASRLKGSIPVGNADFKALDNAVRQKIKDQNVNLAQALAEYKQTSSLFLGTARDVIKAFHSLRSGRNLQNFARILKNPETRNGRKISNRWLELQFGWKPLLSDVFGSAEMLAKGLQQGVVKFAVATKLEEASGTVPYLLGASHYSSTLKKKVHARYFISAGGLKTLSETGITNPLAVAWEIVPWSFVIDWLIPVGDYLAGLDALTGVTNLKVQRSYRYSSETNRALNYSNGNARMYGSTGNLKETTTERFGVDSNLSFGNLRWDPSFTRNRILNAAALLRQLKR